MLSLNVWYESDSKGAVILPCKVIECWRGKNFLFILDSVVITNGTNGDTSIASCVAFITIRLSKSVRWISSMKSLRKILPVRPTYTYRSEIWPWVQMTKCFCDFDVRAWMLRVMRYFEGIRNDRVYQPLWSPRLVPRLACSYVYRKMLLDWLGRFCIF